MWYLLFLAIFTILLYSYDDFHSANKLRNVSSVRNASVSIFLLKLIHKSFENLCLYILSYFYS